jgi:hypothetical protein
VTNTSSALSRRTLLAGLAAAPALTAAAAPVAAQTPAAKTAAERAQAALKDATATKLVLLGTGGGVGGLGPRHTRKMTSHTMLSNGAAYEQSSPSFDTRDAGRSWESERQRTNEHSRPLHRALAQNGVPRSTKMGNIALLWRYNVGAGVARR